MNKEFKPKTKVCIKCKDLSDKKDGIYFKCNRFGWLISPHLPKNQALCDDRLTKEKKK